MYSYKFSDAEQITISNSGAYAKASVGKLSIHMQLPEHVRSIAQTIIAPPPSQNKVAVSVNVIDIRTNKKI